MHTLYYAYGSNMSSRRLRARIASAQAVGVARLAGKRWVLNKLGRDGTAKANLCDDSAGLVWGVLWRVDLADWPQLDRFEGGYDRVEVRVVLRDGSEHAALTYASLRLTARQVASEEYRRWLVEGAREHGLPREWVEELARLPARSDREAR